MKINPNVVIVGLCTAILLVGIGTSIGEYLAWESMATRCIPQDGEVLTGITQRPGEDLTCHFASVPPRNRKITRKATL